MMEAEFNHLNLTPWECKYHVVFTPKHQEAAFRQNKKRHLGQVFHDLARRKECRIEEGHLMPDHVHMLISIPLNRVAQIIGYMKGKSSICIASSSRPTVVTKYPRAQNLWPRKFRILRLTSA